MIHDILLLFRKLSDVITRVWDVNIHFLSLSNLGFLTLLGQLQSPNCVRLERRREEVSWGDVINSLLRLYHCENLLWLPKMNLFKWLTVDLRKHLQKSESTKILGHVRTCPFGCSLITVVCHRSRIQNDMLPGSLPKTESRRNKVFCVLMSLLVGSRGCVSLYSPKMCIPNVPSCSVSHPCDVVDFHRDFHTFDCKNIDLLTFEGMSWWMWSSVTISVWWGFQGVLRVVRENLFLSFQVSTLPTIVVHTLSHVLVLRFGFYVIGSLVSYLG